MSLEVILGVLVVLTVVVFSIVLSFARNEGKVAQLKAVPVEPAAMKEASVVVKDTAPQIVPTNFVQQQTIEEKYKKIESELKEELESLTTANDGLRFDNQALKKELSEMSEKYREVLTKFDQLKAQQEAFESRSIKEKEIAHEQLIQEVEDLRRTQDKLKDLNATMATKADMLQYELIKARAQATGYERISQNYQQQIEQLMNANVKQNRLETHVVES